MSYRIPLRNRAGLLVAEAIVDDLDAALVGGLTWTLNDNGYVWRSTRNQRPRHLYLHRLLGGALPGDGMYVDHINRNRLDNRRSNLRLTTPAESAQNKPTIRGRYRGVSFDHARGKWVAGAQLGGRRHHVGRFASEDEAHRAVVAWRREHMPFAVEEPA